MGLSNKNKRTESTEVETKKFKRMLVIEVAALCILAVLVIVDVFKVPDMIMSKLSSQPITQSSDVTPVVGSKTASQVEGAADTMTPEAVDQLMNEADNAMNDIYALMLQGKFTSEEGLVFNFGYDGSTYEGFVNSNATSVSGTYTVYADGNNNVVKMTAGNEEGIYTFTFTDAGDAMLTDNNSGIVYTLH